MDRKKVKQEINSYSKNDLKEWRAHAVKCLHYYKKYRDDFEIEECNFIIHHIDQKLEELNK